MNMNDLEIDEFFYHQEYKTKLQDYKHRISYNFLRIWSSIFPQYSEGLIVTVRNIWNYRRISGQPGETAQYVMQDPGMAEIFGLFHRIDAAGDCHARADAAVARNYRRAGQAVMTVERFLALVR